MSDKLDKVVLAAVELEQVWSAVGGYIRKQAKVKRTRGGHEAETYRKAKVLDAIQKLTDTVKALALLPDEPIFCMRAKDLAAPAGVLRWIDKAEEVGALSQTLTESRAKYNAFMSWQEKNFQLVKVPT